MKIATAAVTMQSQHAVVTGQQESATLRAWIGQTHPDFEGPGGAQNPAAGATQVQISANAHAAQATEANAIDQAFAAAANDPMLQLIRAMIEWMTGKPVKVFDASQIQTAAETVPAPPEPQPQSPSAPQQAGFGIEYDYHAVREETEQTRYAAAGTIQTTDGKNVAFKLDFTLTRSVRTEDSLSLRAGNAVRKDPLVLNFGGGSAQLSDSTFRFDLDADGRTEALPQLSSGSGYLALDRNANGKIDSGTELFGPTSGSGFAELARLDADGNGWIDQNDPGFGQLRVWQPNAQGGSLSTLEALGVGALFLGRQASPFELRGSGNSNLGAIRDTGLYLTESGQAGTLQEIDLKV